MHLKKILLRSGNNIKLLNVSSTHAFQRTAASYITMGKDATPEFFNDVNIHTLVTEENFIFLYFPFLFLFGHTCFHACFNSFSSICRLAHLRTHHQMCTTCVGLENTASQLSRDTPPTTCFLNTVRDTSLSWMNSCKHSKTRLIPTL